MSRSDSLLRTTKSHNMIAFAYRSGDESHPSAAGQGGANFNVQCKTAPVLDCIGPQGFHNDAGFIAVRSEEHTSELQSLMRISYAVFCLKKKKNSITH